MRDYLDIVETVKNPKGFDDNSGWASERYIKALNEGFLPYVEGDDRPGAISRLQNLKLGLRVYPTLHLLALIKRDGYSYSPSVVYELAQGTVDFLDQYWKDGNDLAREMTRLVAALHDAGLSPIDPADFVLLMTASMEGHRMGRVALREMMVPMQWDEEATEDPATFHLGQALIRSPELQEKVLTKIKNNRFTPALKHYPVEALKVAMDRPSRDDMRLSKDLGL